MDDPVTIRRKEVARRYRAGERIVDIQAALGISHYTIFKDLRSIPGIRDDREEDEIIARKYQLGVPLAEICRTMGLHQTTVQEALGRKGVPLRRPLRLSQKDLAGKEKEIVRRYLAGESGDEIAETLNTSRFIIYLVLKGQGVPRRPRARTAEQLALIRSKRRPQIKVLSDRDPLRQAQLARAKAHELTTLNKPPNPLMKTVSQAFRLQGYKYRLNGAVDVYNPNLVVEHVAIELLNRTLNGTHLNQVLRGDRLRALMKEGYTVVYLRVGKKYLTELETKAIPALFTIIEQTKTDAEPSFYMLDYDGSTMHKGTANEGFVDRISTLRRDYT